MSQNKIIIKTQILHPNKTQILITPNNSLTKMKIIETSSLFKKSSN